MKNNKFIALAFLLILQISKPSFAQTYITGPQILTFFSDVDDTDQPYGCYLPKNYNPKKKYPLVVMLHGAGSNHKLALRRVFGKSNLPNENDVEASLYFPNWEDVNYIVITPNARGTMGYQGIAEKDVWDMIDDAKIRFNIDDNRMFLTGLSMGGGGTLWLGLTRPDVWAAIAPVCPAPPAETKHYTSNAFNMNMHIYQGGADPVVNPINTKEWVYNLKNEGANVEYTEYPGVLHDSWVNAYENGQIFKVFDKYSKNEYPNKVKFTTQQLKYNKSFWVSIVDWENAEKCEVEAHFTAKNQLIINTKNISELGLNIDKHPLYNPKSVLNLSIDGMNIPIFGLWNNQILIKKNQQWTVGKADLEEFKKRPNLEGPMKEVASGRHIYIYGTLDSPSESELLERRKIAEEAANWSYYRGDFMGSVKVYPRVLADNQLRPSDLQRSNLVLFGTKRTNSMINQLKLPIDLKDEYLSNHGLAYIFPNKNRYVLVSSGLPFWKVSGLDNSQFMALRDPSKINKLTNYGDLVLFEEKNASATINLSFNKKWKLNSADLDKLVNSNKLDIK